MAGRRSVRLSLSIVALAFATLWFGWAIEERRPVVLSQGGVVVRRIDPVDIPRGPKVQADVDDLELSSDAVRLIVGASHVNKERRLWEGVLVDATASTWQADALRSLRTVLLVDQGVREPVVTYVRPLLGRETPFIEVRSLDRTENLVLKTTFSVSPGDPSVQIRSELRNASARAKKIRIGDRVSWPGGPSFVPSLGDIETDARTEIRWFARRAPDMAYGLVYPDSEVRANFFVSQRATNQTAWSPETTLAPDETYRLRRVLLTSWRGLSEIADMAWKLLDKPVGYVAGKLDPNPARAVLTAVGSDGTIALRVDANPDGSFRFPLLAGRYSLLLRTAGGVSETLVDVSSGETVWAHLDVPTSGVLKYRVTDSANRPLPARLILNGVGQTSDPELGPDYRASGGRNEIYSATGSGEVEAPPGRYVVTVTHGFEYSVVKKTIDIDAGRGEVLSVILVHEVDTPGWISGDFHVHAAPSMDSEVSLTDRIISLAAAGVDFAVATDHNHVTDYHDAISAVGLNPWIGSAVGVEITTAEWGHFNAYPLSATSPVPPYAGIDPPSIFRAVRHDEPQAIIQVNHPWMPGYGYFQRGGLDERTGRSWRSDFSLDFDAVEVINGFELGDKDALDKNLQRWYALLNSGFRYASVGNSDSHRVSREWAGYPRTYVQVNDDTPGAARADEIADSIRSGRTIVSNGPFVTVTVGNAGPGGTFRMPRGAAPVTISVNAADWVDVQRAEVIVNGELVDVLPMLAFRRNHVRLERTVEMDFDTDGWLMVVVRGVRPLDAVLPGLHSAPFAFTGPVFVDVLDHERPPGPPPSALREQRSELRDGAIEEAGQAIEEAGMRIREAAAPSEARPTPANARDAARTTAAEVVRDR